MTDNIEYYKEENENLKKQILELKSRYTIYKNSNKDLKKHYNFILNKYIKMEKQLIDIQNKQQL